MGTRPPGGVRKGLTFSHSTHLRYGRQIYSITQVYLSPEFHFGEASISNAVRPRIESDVIRVTPIMKGDPPQLSKSRV